MPNGGNILLADRDRDSAAAARLRLCAAGHRVLLAADSREAVCRAVAWRPDVVVLVLPAVRSDGLRTLGWLRAQPETARTPILAIAANRRLARRAFLLGADACLLPYQKGEQFLASIGKLMALAGGRTRCGRYARVDVPGRERPAAPLSHPVPLDRPAIASTPIPLGGKFYVR